MNQKMRTICKYVIVPIGVTILICAFCISSTTGFALTVEFVVGSLGQKLNWW